MHLPLSGIRIVSAQQYGAGPYGTMYLTQLGAEVIKIEPPHKHGPDGTSSGGDTARAVGPQRMGLSGAIPIAPVNALGQALGKALGKALDNPWLATIGMRDSVSHPDRAELAVLANPLKLDGQRLPNRAAPLLGADSDAILGEVGYNAAEIASLRADGVI